MIRVETVLHELKKLFPAATTALKHENSFHLLVATILSAQTTDDQVNRVTPGLFSRLGTPEKMAHAGRSELEKLVGGVNFFRTKAKNLRAMARLLLERHGGRVPKKIEDLVELPGVARKTANVVLGTAFGIPSGIAVDTHVGRVARRLGLSRHDDPVKVERDLTALIPREQWIDFGHRAIWFGRKICQAKRPRCYECPLERACPFPGKVSRETP